MEVGLTANWAGAIDWRPLWLAPMGRLGSEIGAAVAQGLSCAHALNRHSTSAPIHFVPQSALPATQAYEDFIFKTGQVPTRDNLHDFFNGLCWLHFPQTKRRLNQLQAAQIEADGVQAVRGRVRDALTVFDENAAFLHAPDALWQALVAKDWQTLFVTQRHLWQNSHLVLFGHALLEKLVSPRKAITAHVYRVQSPMHSSKQPASLSQGGRNDWSEADAVVAEGDLGHLGNLANLDAWVAADLSADKLASKPFAHLPVLGVPGWWPANEDPQFYDDADVFRAPRPPKQLGSNP